MRTVGYDAILEAFVKPILIVDCYVDGDGARNFQRLLGDATSQVFRAIHQPPPAAISDFGGVIISGSAASVTASDPWMARLSELIGRAKDEGTPVLGVCFGHQLVAEALFGAGTVRGAKTPELGWRDIAIVADDPILAGLGAGFCTFESHFDEVDPATVGLKVLARSEDCAVQAFRVVDRPIWGVQFHSEMTQSEAHDLVARRIGGRPDLGLNLAHELSRAKDSTPIAAALVGNFVSHCEVCS